MSFEENRAGASMRVAKILSWLASEYWEDHPCDDPALIKKLVEGWRIAVERKNFSPQILKIIWNDDQQWSSRVPEAVRAVFDSAHRGTRVRPRDSFPKWPTISEWLRDMEAVIKHFNRPIKEIAALDPDLVRKFWEI